MCVGGGWELGKSRERERERKKERKREREKEMETALYSGCPTKWGPCCYDFKYLGIIPSYEIETWLRLG